MTEPSSQLKTKKKFLARGSGTAGGRKGYEKNSTQARAKSSTNELP